ncbi:PAC2 family-domain-containing protein [Umbelopsis sp. PMI_123]|nr:PAC2 family-domain-containing protein [Umbelopsis sp. PMI_123]
MNTFIPVPGFDPALLKGTTLIIPTVSIANVPQLTIDLYVSSLKLERVGFLDDPSVMPVAGVFESDPSKGITVALEVYQTKDRHFTFVQQRTPIFKGKRQVFLSNLDAFITASAFAKTLIITSTDASRRVDVQMTGVPFRLFASENSFVSERAAEMNLPMLEILPEEEGDLRDQSKEDSDIPRMHGSGIAKKLYARLRAKHPVAILIMFALEGDNLQDTIQYANCLDSLLRIVNVSLDSKFSWTPPVSWQGLFGTPYDPELYQ